jgi:hypothetical protein
METRTRKPREAFLEHAPTGHFFDEFTQTFTFGPPSRRQALRLLAGVPWPPCSAGALVSMRRGR